ncbi:tyrosine-type recombinase/integrase [Anoxynatronum buryatiense]|uniref:Site-specific recombinase XerD n=1 Tax=Anoxynatronum buryatiense TaxID=489973 RepID=A0AA45WSJ6_9CLOT|nr:tyrosine-type recombinase/integrase [Anoxynatronum buryatiense]SMP38382.1 Site-specific recombinase XerD [Anoxynatronum buryatiense]
MRGSVIKKGDKWYISVYLGMKNGKKHRKWYSGYDSREAAEIDLPNILLDIQKGIVVDASTMKASEFFDQWLADHVVPNTSPSTVDKYRAAVKAANVVFGHERIQKITPQHMQRFVNTLVKEGKARHTVISYYTAIKSAMVKAVKWRIILHNPCIDITLPKEKKKAMKTLTAEEVSHLLKSVEGTPMHLVIFLAASCGLRRGEILGLTWRHVDLVNRVIHVTDAWTQSTQGVQMASLKTDSSHRSVDFNDSVKQVLERQKAVQEDFIRQREGNVIRLSDGRRHEMDDQQVCTWQDNEPMRPDYVSKTFKKLLKEADIRPVRFHDLRHTHATLLMKAGVSPKVVQERLGHSDIKVTLGLYSHVIPSMQREAAEILHF